MKLADYTTVIFDMDGVVIDSGPLWQQANTLFFKQFGITKIDYPQILDKLNGKSPADAMRVFQEHYENIKGDPEKLALGRSETVAQLFETQLCYIKGFEKLASKLIENSIKVAIATGADYFLLNKVKTILNLEDYFGKHIYSVEDVNFVSKPDPATFLFAAERLKSDPEECIVIEDAQLGVQAAKAGGMHAIGFKNGEDTEFESADLTVEDYFELANALAI